MQVDCANNGFPVLPKERTHADLYTIRRISDLAVGNAMAAAASIREDSCYSVISLPGAAGLTSQRHAQRLAVSRLTQVLYQHYGFSMFFI